MNTSARKRWLAAALLVLAIIGVGFLPLKGLGINAGLIAALASSLAAVASFMSATESSKTARDALRALSFATKPHLEVKLFNDLPDAGRPATPLLWVENTRHFLQAA